MRAGVDAGIVGDHHDAHAGDDADADDHAAARRPSARRRRRPGSQPASVDSSRKGTPGSSRRATRSRGSSWPRLLEQRRRAWRSRHACAPRSRATARSARACGRGWRGRRRFGCRASARGQASFGASSVVAQHLRRGGEMKAVERLGRSAGADFGPDALRVRRRAVDAQARRPRRRPPPARAGTRSPPRPRSRCRGRCSGTSARMPRIVAVISGG